MNNNTNKFDTCFTIAMQKILNGEGKVFFQGEQQQYNDEYLGLHTNSLNYVVVYTKGAYTSDVFDITKLNLSQKYRMVTKEDL